MHHITDNFIFRKIRRLRKTESGRTVKSLENDELEYFRYESEPGLRVPAFEYHNDDSEQSGESKKSRENESIFDEKYAAEKFNNADYNKFLEEFFRDSDKLADDSYSMRRDSIHTQHSIRSVTSRRTTTSAEFSESVFNLPLLTAAPRDADAATPEAKPRRLLRVPANETPTSSLSEYIANNEVARVLHEIDSSCTDVVSEKNVPNNDGTNNENSSSNNEIRNCNNINHNVGSTNNGSVNRHNKNDDKNAKIDCKNDKIDNKKDVDRHNNRQNPANTSTVALPRNLALPDKVTYRGERINMQISGPVHILTANIHHHHHHHQNRNDETPVTQLAAGAALSSAASLEHYVESLCDFTDVFNELGRRICKRSDGESVLPSSLPARRILPAKKTTSFTYRVATPDAPCTARIERPCSAPYLVQTNSYCHLARVINIMQEWRLEGQPQVGTASRIFWEVDTATAAVTTDEEPVSCFEDTRFDTLKRRENGKTGSKVLKSSFLDQGVRGPKHDQHSPAGDNTKNGCKNTPATVVAESLLPSQPKRQSQPPTPPQRFLHKTQSAAEPPAPSRLPGSYLASADDTAMRFHSLQRTIQGMEADMDAARRFTRESRNREARRIERAILDIGARLSVGREPLTRSQAEANEELLRTRLAAMILDIGPNEMGQNVGDLYEVHDFGILKEPLKILSSKLKFLEQFVEEEDSIRDELNTITRLPSASRQSNIIQKRKRALKQRGEEIARMTPLISVVKKKLAGLEDVVDERAERTSGRVTPYQERKTVHDLLTGINAEINTIHALCRQQGGSSASSVNNVVSVLSRMCVSLDAILDTLRDTAEKTGARQHRKSGEAPSVKKFNTCEEFAEIAGRVYQAHCNVDVKHEEEHESVLSFIISSGRRGILPITPRLRAQASIATTPTARRGVQKSAQTSIAAPKCLLAADVRRTSSVKSAQINGGTGGRSREKSSLAIPVPHSISHNRTYFSESRDVECSLNVAIARRDRMLSTAGNFLVQPRGIDISLSVRACGAISAEESDDTRRRPSRLSASWRAADVGESSEFGDASSLVFDESPIFFPDAHNQRSSIASAEVDWRQELSESPNAAKRGNAATGGIPAQNGANAFAEIRTRDDESVSEPMTLSVPILFHLGTPRETAILSDDDGEVAGAVRIYNMRSSCTETFDLRRRNKRAVLNAIVYPQTRAAISATAATDAFEVVVERVEQSGRQSVVMVSEEYYSKKVKITRRCDPIDEILRQLNGGDVEVISDDDENDQSVYAVETLARLNVSIMARSVCDSVLVHLEVIPWGAVEYSVTPGLPLDVMTASCISQQTVGTTSSCGAPARDTASVVSNIIVSENQDEARSLTLAEQHSGSARSLATTMSATDVDIPAYVIKRGSTVSITCEMNTYACRETPVEWYRGREPINTAAASHKYDRISHDLIEVLVIMRVDADDGQLYSIRVHGELYPVAYLIIEDGDEDGGGAGDCETPKLSEPPAPLTAAAVASAAAAAVTARQQQHAFFISPPQTMFVMQGQTAIISCQMSAPNMDVVWYRDSERIQCGADDRIFFERTPSAWYRLIIEDVDFVDQGVYYAFFHDRSTTINLIVEERIDEREVQVSSAETDDDELSDYLVPIGSTATIACELDSSVADTAAANAQHQLHWQRDNVDITTAEVGGGMTTSACRFEHVRSENKHYLIIHNAQPADSGVYSVLVNGVRFKVAQITIGQHRLLLKKSSQLSVGDAPSAGATSHSSRRRASSHRIKRISNNSLQQVP